MSVHLSRSFPGNLEEPPYRGLEDVPAAAPMGHECVGTVTEAGSEVRTVKPGDFVVGSFWASDWAFDNTCEICRAGFQSRCVQAHPMGAIGTQARFARIPLADGTLVATPGQPDADLLPSLRAASDVVGDGAVGLLAVLAARQLGAERVIAMSRHPGRQELARLFGATDIVAIIRDMRHGHGAHSVVEAVETQESMMQAVRSTRPGGHMGFVGVSHDVALPGLELFFAEINMLGGPAPVRRGRRLYCAADICWTLNTLASGPRRRIRMAAPPRDAAAAAL